MKTIKALIKKLKAKYYEFMINRSLIAFEQAKVDSNDKECAYWDAQYIKYLAKKDSLDQK